MRLITVEEHFASPGFRAGPGREFMGRLGNSGARGARIVEQLTDVGSNRIAEMDAAGIEMQVVSLNAPGVEQADPDVQISLAQEANDFIAEAVKKYPKRLAAFAALPIAAPEKAADEFNRRVRREGFKGALIMATHAAVILTRGSSRPFLSALKPLTCRYTCIRPYRRSPSWMHFTLVLLLR